MYHGSKLNVPLSEPTLDMESIIGFYTTRIVVAGSELEAMEKAMAQLLGEEQVKNLIATTKDISGNEPIIEIERVQKLSWHQDRLQKHKGFTFYANDKDT